MTGTKQTKLSALLAEQRFDDRRLAASFVEMAGALPARPEPAHLFHNAASPGRVAYRGMVLVLAARAAMRSAIASGDRALIEETARRIDHHFEDAKSVALADYHRVASGACSLSEATEMASRETADMSVALTRLALHHDEASRDETVREIDAEMLRLVNLRVQLFPGKLGAATRRMAVV